jgi:hypothetical protein
MKLNDIDNLARAVVSFAEVWHGAKVRDPGAEGTEYLDRIELNFLFAIQKLKMARSGASEEELLQVEEDRKRLFQEIFG